MESKGSEIHIGKRIADKTRATLEAFRGFIEDPIGAKKADRDTREVLEDLLKVAQQNAQEKTPHNPPPVIK